MKAEIDGVIMTKLDVTSKCRAICKVLLYPLNLWVQVRELMPEEFNLTDSPAGFSVWETS